MYKLYNVKGWGSMAPHFVLEEMDLAYENVWMTPEQVRQPAFREISPLGLIPALGLDDGRAIFESAAIIGFLTAAHPDKGLAPPPGSNDHGIYLAWLAFMSSNIYPAINLAFLGRPLVDTEEDFAMLGRGGDAHANRLFDIVDERLGREGPYMLGESFSAADIYLFMLALWAKPSERALLERCRNIARVSEEVRRRPKLRATLEVHGVGQQRG
jgi:glutathione S-transferase